MKNSHHSKRYNLNSRIEPPLNIMGYTPKDDDLDTQEHLEDGIDDFISTPKETPYNDDDYDY